MGAKVIQSSYMVENDDGTVGREPTIMECEVCMKRLHNYCPGADIRCDCGALYNAFGQRLRDDAPICGPNGFGPDVPDYGDIEHY